MRKYLILALVTVSLGLISAGVAAAIPSPHDDPLVRMPGSQPAEVIDLAGADSCARCHADYNASVEPVFNWQGSMMAQAARDPLFFATMAVATQDAMWATGGNPNAADMCLRCHFPGGWLDGRSDPVNATEMRGDDYDGVTCDLCHRMYDPFSEDTYAGTREGNDWAGYWDETNASETPSNAAALEERNENRIINDAIAFFNGDPFFGADNRPVEQGYIESGGGQFFISPSDEKRGPFADSAKDHEVLYSRYHKSKYFCSTCHDVSNAVLANLTADPSNPLPTEMDPAFAYFHVERTSSEFMLSAYARDGGSPGKGLFAPDNFTTSLPENAIGRCQDCHMRDLSGRAANKDDALFRPDESEEHTKSGHPLHDLTGGNTWISTILASAIPGSPNYDAVNNSLLYGNETNLTMDLTQGFDWDPAAILAGAERARQQLELAATIENLNYDPASGALSFRVQNNTGHKLISGYPEGRRMFVTIQAYRGDSLIYEVNPYDANVGTLKGLPGGIPLTPGEVYVDSLVYESKPSSQNITGEATTFHFALATNRYKDNRIPPKGFEIASAAERMVQPRWKGVDALDYYTAAEYAGGYDQVSLAIPKGADRVEVDLYYQTTSREYVEFLKNEINATPGKRTLPDEAYVIQTDDFLAGYRGWGDTMWALWEHNKDLPGAAPYRMAFASFQADPPTCAATPPQLLSAVAGSGQVNLAWSNEHAANPAIDGYRVYYDQAGKTLFRGEVGPVTSFLDDNLTGDEQYCYAVSSYTANCESAVSNVVCASPKALNRFFLPLMGR